MCWCRACATNRKICSLYHSRYFTQSYSIKCSLQYKMKRVFRGKEQDMLHRLEMVLYIHYNSENIWRKMAGKNILFKKNHYCLWQMHILLGWLILNYTNNLKSYVWSFGFILKITKCKGHLRGKYFSHLKIQVKWGGGWHLWHKYSTQNQFISIFVYWYMNGVIMEN